MALTRRPMHTLSSRVASPRTVDYPITKAHPPLHHSILPERHQLVDCVLATQQVCRMRGGTQAQLIRCSDGGHYVVKFKNNPQGTTVLASDLLGTLLAIRLGLPTQHPVLVDVREDLIRNTEDMVIQVRGGRLPCQSGLCFGSRYPHDESTPGNSWKATVYDLLPKANLVSVRNPSDFAGMLVFDQWTCNTDRRQTIFVRQSDCGWYHASMIDQGACFNGAEWNFPDSPLRGLYEIPAIYRGYCRVELFEPWLSRLEQKIDQETLQLAGAQIPPEWYGWRLDRLARLLEVLDRRRKRVRDLLWSVLKASPATFSTSSA
jgi:hypothetical protein